MNTLDTFAVTSWYDILQLEPRNPGDLIAYAEIVLPGPPATTVVGECCFSDSFGKTTGAWAQGLALTGTTMPVCVANDATDGQAVADADQWNFAHLTRLIDPTRPPELSNTLFLRSGTSWVMEFAIVADAVSDRLELSFLNNAGTRGDAQGTIPVIRFTGAFPHEAMTLRVTLKSPGSATLGLIARAPGTGDCAVLAMNWIVVDEYSITH